MVLMSGDEMEALLKRTLATRLTCMSCGATFTFEQGGKAAMDSGANGKVKCTSCGLIHAADVQPWGITLGANGRTKSFPASQDGEPAKKGWRFWKK